MFSHQAAARSWPLRICDCPGPRVRRVTVGRSVDWLVRCGGERSLMHFAFLHSCATTQPSAASHPGRLLFPTRNCFQVTCLRRFPAALLSLAVTLRPGDPESTDQLRAPTAGRTTPACQTLPEDRDRWASGAAGDIFTFKPGCSIPALSPSDPSPAEETEGREGG